MIEEKAPDMQFRTVRTIAYLGGIRVALVCVIYSVVDCSAADSGRGTVPVSPRNHAPARLMLLM